MRTLFRAIAANELNPGDLIRRPEPKLPDETLCPKCRRMQRTWYCALCQIDKTKVHA